MFFIVKLDLKTKTFQNVFQKPAWHEEQKNTLSFVIESPLTTDSFCIHQAHTEWSGTPGWNEKKSCENEHTKNCSHVECYVSVNDDFVGFKFWWRYRGKRSKKIRQGTDSWRTQTFLFPNLKFSKTFLIPDFFLSEKSPNVCFWKITKTARRIDTFLSKESPKLDFWKERFCSKLGW